MRLYYDLDENHPVLKDICELACNDNNLDLCEVKNLPGTPVVDGTDIFARDWRFFPATPICIALIQLRSKNVRYTNRNMSIVDFLKLHLAMC